MRSMEKECLEPGETYSAQHRAAVDCFEFPSAMVSRECARDNRNQKTLTPSHERAPERSMSASRLTLGCRIASTATSSAFGSSSSSFSISISARTCPTQSTVSVPPTSMPGPSPSSERLISVLVSTSLLNTSSDEVLELGRALEPSGGDARISANRRVMAASDAASSSSWW